MFHINQLNRPHEHNCFFHILPPTHDIIQRESGRDHVQIQLSLWRQPRVVRKGTDCKGLYLSSLTQVIFVDSNVWLTLRDRCDAIAATAERFPALF